MYYPIQVPYILNKMFSEHILYTEEIVTSLQDFVICVWEMTPRTVDKKDIPHIIVADGCIDLVVDYNSKTIGFGGMSKTYFNDVIQMPDKFCGARMKPGAFQQLTGLPATAAMDKFVSLKILDSAFDIDTFFSLPFEQTKVYFIDYLHKLVSGKQPNSFVKMFDEFSTSPPFTAAELYETLNLGPRQCQRLFMKHFGITPQMALSILRFQRCVEILTSKKANPNEVLEATTYYDQSHFIKDFKRNIGLTPFEYLQKV